jgi:hypothetical protein
VAGLSSVDPTFPLYLWDILLPQAEITLNLFRTSRLHPQLSATAHFYGLVDYNKTSFAPPGCKIIANERPGRRRTWATHGQHGYSLGPAMHHYRCKNVYILATASEHIVDTLEFFPHNYQMPQLSSTDRFIMAANEMSNALKNPHPEVPFTYIGDDTISALTALAEIFKNKFQKVHIPELPAAPAKVTQRTFPVKSSNPILASPTPSPRQTRSQTTIHAQDITNTPFLSGGGHTNNKSASTSEGAKTLTKSFSPKIVPRRLWRHGHCPHDHRPGKPTLVPAAPSQCSRSPNHRKRNGIHGPHERPSHATNRFGNEVLATKSDACFKTFATSPEPTHVSLSNSQTSRKTDRSLTAK